MHKTTLKSQFFIAMMLAYLALGLSSQINNNDKIERSQEVSKKSSDSATPDVNPKHPAAHPALHPGFPYIWPYYQTPYFHPYHWPMYLYHGQYAPFIPKSGINKKNAKKAPYMETLVFIGKFAGTCKSYPNGLYYIDSKSFAYCSNGIKTTQNCPEGAENPPLSEFYKGLYRFVHDFCSVNLLVNKVPIRPEAFLQRLTRKHDDKKPL